MLGQLYKFQNFKGTQSNTDYKLADPMSPDVMLASYSTTSDSNSFQISQIIMTCFLSLLILSCIFIPLKYDRKYIIPCVCVLLLSTVMIILIWALPNLVVIYLSICLFLIILEFFVVYRDFFVLNNRDKIFGRTPLYFFILSCLTVIAAQIVKHAIQPPFSVYITYQKGDAISLQLETIQRNFSSDLTSLVDMFQRNIQAANNDYNKYSQYKSVNDVANTLDNMDQKIWGNNGLPIQLQSFSNQCDNLISSLNLYAPVDENIYNISDATTLNNYINTNNISVPFLISWFKIILANTTNDVNLYSKVGTVITNFRDIISTKISNYSTFPTLTAQQAAQMKEKRYPLNSTANSSSILLNEYFWFGTKVSDRLNVWYSMSLDDFINQLVILDIVQISNDPNQAVVPPDRTNIVGIQNINGVNVSGKIYSQGLNTIVMLQIDCFTYTLYFYNGVIVSMFDYVKQMLYIIGNNNSNYNISNYTTTTGFTNPYLFTVDLTTLECKAFVKSTSPSKMMSLNDISLNLSFQNAQGLTLGQNFFLTMNTSSQAIVSVQYDASSQSQFTFLGNSFTITSPDSTVFSIVPINNNVTSGSNTITPV